MAGVVDVTAVGGVTVEEIVVVDEVDVAGAAVAGTLGVAVAAAGGASLHSTGPRGKLLAHVKLHLVPDNE